MWAYHVPLAGVVKGGMEKNGEMARGLRVHTALAEVPGLTPRPTSGGSQLPITPIQGIQYPLSEL